MIAYFADSADTVMGCCFFTGQHFSMLPGFIHFSLMLMRYACGGQSNAVYDQQH